MKIKELLLPVGLALITTWLIQHFFFREPKITFEMAKEVKSGQKFVAPKRAQEYRPINREIDFIDERQTRKVVKTEVETELAKFVFSNDGASIDRIEFKRRIDRLLQILGTVFPVSETERESRCFLVALNEKTPYYYTLVDKDETDSFVSLSYHYDSPVSDIIVDKKFTVFKKTHKIDLLLEIIPKKTIELDGVEARIFFPSPFMPELRDSDTTSAVFTNEKGAVEKINRKNLGVYDGWLEPKLFGADNKYFVHAMIDDPHRFTQRAYYKISNKNMLFSILEGPTVKEKSSWNLSFYFGPKEEKALVAVDARLEKTLEYSGLLAPIAKFLLMILNFFYKYLRNYGLAIIALTALIRLLLLPFSIRAEKGAKKQAEFQRKMQYLKQKYKDDKVAFAREQSELVRQHGIMPGLGSCLPLFLQLPIFFALSRVLMSSIELYKAPFMLWIQDLSAKDPYFILPGLIVVSMLLQALTLEASQRMPIIIMALVFGALSASFSAGLSLYIVASTILGVAQTAVQKRWKVS